MISQVQGSLASVVEEADLSEADVAVVASETVTVVVVVDSEIVVEASVTVAEVDSAVVVEAAALVIVIAEVVALEIEAASEAVEVTVEVTGL